VRKISGAVIAMNDNNMPLSPADEIAAVHLMLDRHSVPRDHPGQKLSLSHIGIRLHGRRRRRQARAARKLA
jgi:hypothetical protein